MVRADRVAVAAALPGLQSPVESSGVVEGLLGGFAEKPAVTQRVALTLTHHRVLEVPRITHQRPPRPARDAVEGRQVRGGEQFALVRGAFDTLGQVRILGELLRPDTLRIPAEAGDVLDGRHPDDQHPAEWA